MRLLAFTIMLLVALTSGGCFSSADHPPTPTTASFNMHPVPKRDGGSGGGAWSAITEAPGRIGGFFTGLFTGKSPLSDVRRMENSKFADQRRQGIYNLVAHDFAQYEPYTKRYRQIAQK